MGPSESPIPRFQRSEFQKGIVPWAVGPGYYISRLQRFLFGRLTVIKIAGCLLLFLFLASVAQPGLSSNAAIKPQAVKVYFYHDPGEHIDLSPVTRMIRTRAPARAAINALLAGPTRREEKKGFGSLVNVHDFTVGSLTISEGTARVNFVSTKNWHGWPGDLGPVRFKTAVELTLKQFGNVEQVVVSLDGEENFWKEG
jgi:hypothetical protein